MNETAGSWGYAKTFFFTEHVTCASPQWQEIAFYETAIITPKLANLLITLHIPYAGNESGGTRNRIRLDFDDAPLCDATKHNAAPWELHEITLTGLVENVAAGDHTLRLFAQVSGGCLHIPHYNTTLIEATSPPPIFANLALLGFRK